MALEIEDDVLASHFLMDGHSFGMTLAELSACDVDSLTALSMDAANAIRDAEAEEEVAQFLSRLSSVLSDFN